MPGAVKMALSPEVQALMIQTADRRRATTYNRELVVVVDREKARFSAWYEMFPRSCSMQPGEPGTLQDCANRLNYVAAMGFDVVYLPPLHPIGRINRKTHESRGIQPLPNYKEGKLRYNWNTPIARSPHDPRSRNRAGRVSPARSSTTASAAEDPCPGGAT